MIRSSSRSPGARQSVEPNKIRSMSFYRNHIYPQLVARLGDPPPIREVRQKIVPLAQDEVLEIGVGPGVNFAHYDTAKVTKVYGLEPNPGMIRLAEREKGQTKLDLEFLDLPGERIPLKDASVDAVVSTFTLCTIPGVAQALTGIRRVLKPGGKLILFEHGLSPYSRVRRWQERCEPINRCIFGGCHLTRDIPSLLTQGGFQIQELEVAYVADFPKPWTYCWWVQRRQIAEAVLSSLAVMCGFIPLRTRRPVRGLPPISVGRNARFT
jgi:SAM-dependent methyltransferase